MFTFFLVLYLVASISALSWVAYYGISEHIKAKRGDYDHLYEDEVSPSSDEVVYFFEKTPFLDIDDIKPKTMDDIKPKSTHIRVVPHKQPLSHIPSHEMRGRQKRVISRAWKRRII